MSKANLFRNKQIPKPQNSWNCLVKSQTLTTIYDATQRAQMDIPNQRSSHSEPWPTALRDDEGWERRLQEKRFLSRGCPEASSLCHRLRGRGVRLLPREERRISIGRRLWGVHPS